MCEECREIAREIKQCFGQLKLLFDGTQEDRLRVVEALRRGTEEFFTAQAPRLPGMARAMERKFMHEQRTGHRVNLDAPR